MAFNHLAGVTTPGAPDEIIDWFATFEAWMTGVLGWTVEAGAGTVDIIFRSLGEAGGLTMLYMHVWRVGVGNTIRIELQNDLAGTQFTNEAGTLDSGGVQFAYWMTGDMDAIVICWKVGAGYRSIYAGLVIPFALTIPDETYQMIVTSQVDRGSILRNFNNVWDVDINMTDHTFFDNAIFDTYDGSLTLGGLFANTGVNIAGQFKHISAVIFEPGVTAEDTITTGRPGATSEWVVVADHVPNRFAMRTGGVLPTGISMTGASVAFTSGVAANWAAFLAAMTAFMVGIGWTDRGDPGLFSFGHEWYSQGESGVDEIYTGYTVFNAAPDETRTYCWDDAAHTHAAFSMSIGPDDTEFPLNYWITADLDCWTIVFQTPPGFDVFWCGKLEPFAPGLVPPYPGGVPLTEYSLLASVIWGANARIVRRHDGVWVGAGLNTAAGAPANSSPNAFDGVTYMVWPFAAFYTIGAGQEPYGMMKYIFHAQGGGLANMDTITVAGQVYTYFTNPIGLPFCIRTA